MSNVRPTFRTFLVFHTILIAWLSVIWLITSFTPTASFAQQPLNPPGSLVQAPTPGTGAATGGYTPTTPPQPISACPAGSSIGNIGGGNGPATCVMPASCSNGTPPQNDGASTQPIVCCPAGYTAYDIPQYYNPPIFCMGPDVKGVQATAPASNPVCPAGWSLSQFNFGILPNQTTAFWQAMCSVAASCPANYTFSNNECVPSNNQASTGTPSVPFVPFPLICREGDTKLSNGACCPSGQVTTAGTCCPSGQMPSGGACITYYPPRGPVGTPGLLPPSVPGQSVAAPGVAAPGTPPPAPPRGVPVQVAPPCPTPDANGQCGASAPLPIANPCPPGQALSPGPNGNGFVCVPLPSPISPCPAGFTLGADRNTCYAQPLACAAGTQPALPGDVPFGCCPGGTVAETVGSSLVCSKSPGTEAGGTPPVAPTCAPGSAIDPKYAALGYYECAVPAKCPNAFFHISAAGQCVFVPPGSVITDLPGPSPAPAPAPLPGAAQLPVPPPPPIACSAFSGEVAQGGACQCPAGARLGPTGQCQCSGGDLANGRECPPQQRPCPPGQETSTFQCCPPGSTALGATCSIVCPPGQVQERDGKCGPIPTPPAGGCPPGEVRDPRGGCMLAPVGTPAGPAPIAPVGTPALVAPTTPQACPPPLVKRGDTCVQPCPSGLIPSPNGTCAPHEPPPKSCPPGQVPGAKPGTCVCDNGQPPRDGRCVATKTPTSKTTSSTSKTTPSRTTLKNPTLTRKPSTPAQLHITAPKSNLSSKPILRPRTPVKSPVGKPAKTTS
jgi:hypothetical protein